MDLFEVINGKAMPSVHALIISPYKEIWEKDPNEDKGEAINVFTYIELMCSPKKSNPFFTVDVRIRPAKVRKEVWKDEKYRSDIYTVNEIIEGVYAYQEHLKMSAPGYELYISAINAADKLKNFLDEFEPNERNKAGMLILKPKDITSALNDVPTVIKSLKENRETLLAEVREASKTRNQREIGAYER